MKTAAYQLSTLPVQFSSGGTGDGGQNVFLQLQLQGEAVKQTAYLIHLFAANM